MSTIYPEDLEVISNIATAYGLLCAIDSSGLTRRENAILNHVCDKLSDAMKVIEELDGMYRVDLSDPSNLEEIARTIRADEHRERESLDATYGAMRYGGHMTRVEMGLGSGVIDEMAHEGRA